MSLIAAATRFVERAPLPDALSKFGVAALVDRASRSLSRRTGTSEVEFVREMDRFPVALHVGQANRQHYELPADFFALALGPARKYSCCLYRPAKRRLPKPRLSLSKQPLSAPTSKMGSKFWNSDAAGVRSVCSWPSASHRRASRPCRIPPRSGATSNMPRPNVALKTFASSPPT